MSIDYTDFDLSVCELTVRKPSRVDASNTRYLREILIPKLAANAELPKLTVVYATATRRGFAHYRQRRITVPNWAITHKDGELYTLWYLGHELAHIANFIQTGINCDVHGPQFMQHLKRIVPQSSWHYELGYKPRNAAAAGIEQEFNDL